MKEFGDWLKQERKFKGWSQFELSDRSGVSQSTICEVEKGIRNRGGVELYIADALAGALGKKLSDVFKWIDERRAETNDKKRPLLYEIPRNT